MDSYPVYRSPPETVPGGRLDTRWSGRDDDVYQRRSPGPQERRYRQRNRSRSPLPIDRYQPDMYYGGPPRDRDMRRRPSPVPAHIDRYVPGQDVKPVLINPVPDPHKLDYQVGFSYFAEWWRHNEAIKEERERQRTGGRRPLDRIKGERESRDDRAKERAQIQAAYDSYKEELQIKMAKTFVQSHRGEEWLKERYMPSVRDEIRARLHDFRREYYITWERDMDKGTFDEFTLEGIYKSDSNGAGGPVEKEEGEAIATAEVLGVGDLLPLKGGDIRDEAVFQPALLIKTISPTVSRAKLEEFCKENLGESVGGFKWLGLSDPNPSKRYHRIGWVILHPGADSGFVIDRGDGRGEEREDGDDGDENATPVEQNATSSTAERALEAINGKTIHDEVKGDFTIHVGVHVPPSEPRKKALWDLFSAPERIERDLQLAQRLVAKLDSEMGAGVDAVTKVEEKVNRLRDSGALKTYTAASTKDSTSPVKSADLGTDEDDVVKTEDAEMVEEEEGVFDEEADDEDLLITKKKLDLLVEYLRRVYNFCFFCVFESDSVHELVRKCPGGHLRRPRASLSTAAKAAAKASAMGESFPSKKEVKEEGDGAVSPRLKFQRTSSKNEQQLQRAFNWVKTYEDKILQILEPDNVDIRKLGGKPLEEAIDEELSKFVKQEDENKFRCKVPECTKLFKAEHFWRKHVDKRHPEWFDNIKQDIILVNNYVLDPAHIAPSRSDANSNGHFPPNNSFQGGTPRGFSMNSMPMGFNPGLPGGMFPPAAGFPPFFPQNPLPMPGTWGPPGADLHGGDDRHHPGPVRRGGNYRNVRTGPYDRRSRDGRDARWNGVGGRLTPPRGGGGPGGRPGGGGNKWGDGAGVAAVGPREAVQGRNLKNYEDLDAVGGGAGSELNY